MIALTSNALRGLRDAAREIGETTVTVATDAGVITFHFDHAQATAHVLPHDSSPTRQQLAAMFGIPLTAETA